MTHDQYPEAYQDPLAGDVDKYVPSDETRTDEETDQDDLIANRLHMSGDVDSDAYWQDYDRDFGADDQSSELKSDDSEKETKNPYILLLERTIKERAIAKGLSEEEAGKVDAATFFTKDSEGNIEDILHVDVSHYKSSFERPGVKGFRLETLNGEKNVDGWPVRKVRGLFYADSDGPNSYSMSYDGNSESTRTWVAATILPEVLASADVELHVLDQE